MLEAEAARLVAQEETAEAAALVGTMVAVAALKVAAIQADWAAAPLVVAP